MIGTGMAGRRSTRIKEQGNRQAGQELGGQGQAG